MGHEGSAPYLKDHGIGSCPESNESSPHPGILFF
jgi:hypothetical protein